MSDQGGPSRPDPALYPDIAQAGDLVSALQAEFDASGLRLQALPQPAPGWRYVGARVQDTERSAAALMGIRERVFTVTFWTAGVQMAWGSTDELPPVAGAMYAWLSGSRVRELASGWPFVSFSSLSEAHERGEAVEYTWRRYLENPRQAPQLSRLHPVIALAIREPRLRSLLPFTSHYMLGFSRTPGYPHSGDCPWVQPLDDGRYRVMAAGGRRLLGIADAAGAVALVLAALDEEVSGDGTAIST